MNTERIQELIEKYNLLTREISNFNADTIKPSSNHEVSYKRYLNQYTKNRDRLLRQRKPIEIELEKNQDLFNPTFGEFVLVLKNRLLELYPNLKMNFDFEESGMFSPSLNKETFSLYHGTSTTADYTGNISAVIHLGDDLPDVELGKIGSFRTQKEKPYNFDNIKNNRITHSESTPSIKEEYENVQMNLLKLYLLYDPFDSIEQQVIKNNNNPVGQKLKQACYDVIERNLKFKQQEM